MPGAFECWPFFDPKLLDMMPLKGHFLNNFPMGFAEIVFGDAKLIINKVPIISFALISSLIFKLLRKFSGGGHHMPLPPPQANGRLRKPMETNGNHLMARKRASGN